MWIYLALFYAFWNAISSIYIKRLTQSVSPQHVTILIAFFSLPFMIPLILMSGGVPQTTPELYKLMIASAILDTFAFAMAYQALKTSPISLIYPLTSFSPVITTFLAYIFIKEIPSPIKLLGILTIVLGVYVLNISDAKKGVHKPFTNLLQNRGVQLFFGAFVLWAITPVIQKAALSAMSPQVPLFASFIGYVFVIIFMSVFSLITKQKIALNEILKHKTAFIILGATVALAQYAAYNAFSLAPVGIVVSVFRLSALISVIAGGFFFKEKNLVSRFIGATIMVAGAVLLLI